jgi:hypothetical protein
MRTAGRFILVMLLVSALITVCGRIFSDFDEPPENDPYDLFRGIGIWIVAVLVAVLNELRIRRRRSSKAD